MSILLNITAFDDATISFIDAGGILRSPLRGAAMQRLNRLGDHFAVTYNVGDVESSSAEGRELRQQLIQAKLQGARALFPQDGLDTGTPGSPVVNGAGQTGSALNIRGFTAGYNVFVGQPFSLIHAGRRYLHTANVTAIAASNGQTAVSLAPMLRVSPADGAVLEFATPYIEGLITSDVSWVYTPGNWQGQTVTIEEAA